MPKRVQLKRTDGWRIPPNTVIVSRQNRKPGTGYGNPYNWKTDYEFYPDDLKKRVAKLDFSCWMKLLDGFVKDFPEQRRWIIDHLPELAKADYIACWCKLDEPCHGDVLIELIKEMEIE